MSERNENRPGYKKTKVGWIPEAWDCVPISDLISELLPGVSVNTDDRPCKAGESGVLKASAVANGVFFPEENKVIKPEEIRRARGRPSSGNLIISRANTSELVGTCGYVSRDYDDLFLPDKLWQTYFSQSNPCCAEWLNALLQIPQCRYEIAVRATGTSGSMKNISQRSFLSIRVPLPPFPEQKKIAEILSAWDEAIDQMRRQIDAKKRCKKALMQQLLTGKKRLPGFKGSWREYHLGDVFNERREVNGDHLPLLAITGSRGVIPASEIERKDSSNPDKSRYKIIRRGDIGYNTMRMWQGVSAVSALDGIVSPAYTICMPKADVDVQFMGYFFKFPPVVHLFWRYSQGLVSDTLNLKFNNFAQIKVTIPNLKEQCAIAKVLSSADDEIATLEKKLTAFEKQKRGLMQKLLTGEVRVKA